MPTLPPLPLMKGLMLVFVLGFGVLTGCQPEREPPRQAGASVPTKDTTPSTSSWLTKSKEARKRTPHEELARIMKRGHGLPHDKQRRLLEKEARVSAFSVGLEHTHVTVDGVAHGSWENEVPEGFESDPPPAPDGRGTIYEKIHHLEEGIDHDGAEGEEQIGSR